MNPLKVFFVRIYQALLSCFARLVRFPEPKRLNGIEEIVKVLKAKNIHKLFVVTGNTTGKKPFAQKLLSSLQEEGIEPLLYYRDKTDPSIELIEKMKESYLSLKAEAILSLGGGSSLDSGKALAASLANPKKDLRKMGGLLKVGGKLPLHIV